MNEIIQLHDENDDFPVSGRELHEQLGIATSYKDWFPRMREFGFEEGKDFCSKMSESTGGRPATDHMLTLSMAKELCMLQRTEVGREVRRYMIGVEDAWNSPELVMSRALRFANRKIAEVLGEVRHLQAANSELTVKNQVMLPKAEYFDDLVDRGANLSFRETAKELRVKEKALIGFLLEHRYVYRDRKGKLMPYAQHASDGLFSIKEEKNPKTNWAGTQTLVTTKGREAFRRLTTGMRGEV